MKIFISWSGDSRGVADALNAAIPTFFDNAEPWISTENRSGAMWLPEIDRELSATDFGIVCVTKSNQHAPWLNFEAGALSRKVDAKKELMPVLLIDFDDTNEVTSPLVGFHMKMATFEGVFDVMKDLNGCKLGPHISEKILHDRVEAAWPALKIELDKVKTSKTSAEVVKRTPTDKIDEILNTVRQISDSATKRNWSDGSTAVRLSNPEKSAIAKVVGSLIEGSGLGEMTVTYPDNARALIATERPVDLQTAQQIAEAVSDEVWTEIEIAYQLMTAEEVLKQKHLMEQFERFGRLA